MKGLRPLYARGCRMRWLQLFNMNHVTTADREDRLRAERQRDDASERLTADHGSASPSVNTAA